MQAADEYEFLADKFKTQPVITDTYPIEMVMTFQFFHGSYCSQVFCQFHLIDDLTDTAQQ